MEPLGGMLGEGCVVKDNCWARRMAGRIYSGTDFNKVRYFPERLGIPLRWKKPRRIGVGWMGDIGGTSFKYARKIMRICRRCPQHTFLFLTKQTWFFDLFGLRPLPDNCWLGFNYTGTQKEALVQPGFYFLMRYCGNLRYVSFEPLLEWNKRIVEIINWVDWVIVGAETCNGRLVKEHAPKREWIEEIVGECRKRGKPVFLKDNLREIWGSELMQEMP